MYSQNSNWKFREWAFIFVYLKASNFLTLLLSRGAALRLLALNLGRLVTAATTK